MSKLSREERKHRRGIRKTFKQIGKKAKKGEFTEVPAGEGEGYGDEDT